MHTDGIMRKIFFFTLIILLVHAPAVAALEPVLDLPHVMIVEVQTGSLATGTEEFIELYNPTSQPIDITGWRLQYRAATTAATSAWTSSHTKATVTCLPAVGETTCSEVIPPLGRTLFATYATVEPALPLNGGFALSGGQIRLVRPIATGYEEVDLLGYGTAITFEGTGAAPAPQAGQSLKRVVQSGLFIDSNNNSTDFFVDCGQPTPGAQTPPSAPTLSDSCSPLVPEQQAPEPADPDPNPPIDQPQAEPKENEALRIFLPLEITEVFPDPVSPQQDGHDEFVEIYNPNNEAINVEDYVLQMGSSLQYKVVLGNLVLPPHTFAAVSSSDSSLSLSNSGTVVRIIDPNGQVRDEAPHFGKAVAGASWAKDTTGWHWTTTPTPTAANIIVAPAAKPSAKKVKAASVQKTTPKTDVPQATPAQEPQTEDQVEATTTAAVTTQSHNYWVVGLVALVALGYAVFEYRQEVGRFISGVRTKLGHSNGDSEIVKD